MELFGQYSLIVATLAFVSSLNLGLPQSVVRSLSRNHSDQSSRQTIWATSSQLFALTGIIGACVATVISYYLHVRYQILPLIFALSLINSLVAHYLTLPHAEGHFGYFNAKTFLVGTANTLLAAYLSYSGQSILEILIAQLVCYLVSLIFLVHFSLKYFPRPWQYRSSKQSASTLVNFGIKSQVGTIVGQFQAQYGKYLLAAVSPLHLSAYVIATGLVQKAAGGVVQVATAIYPSSARDTHAPDFAKTYYRLQMGLGITSIVGVIFYKQFGHALLTWWLDNPAIVAPVHTVLSILVYYLAILVLTPLASTLLDGRGRPELTSLLATITTAIEIAVALFLYPHYGYLAPAYGALIAISLTTPVLLMITSRVLQSKT